MYNSSGLYPNRIHCTHSTVLEDDVSGTVVCTQCGLVLIDQTYSQAFSLPLFDKANRDLWYVKIKDVLSAWPHVEERMYDIIYHRYLKEKKNRSNIQNPIKLLACITYNELIKDDYGCLPNDVAQLFGIKTSDICSFPNLSTDKASPNIVPISNRYCSLLNLSFEDKNIIASICDTLKDDYNTNLKTLCILVIWYYCIRQYPKTYSLAYIANTCQCNYLHLKRVIKKRNWARLEEVVREKIDKTTLTTLASANLQQSI